MNVQLIYKCNNCNEIVKQVKNLERMSRLEEIASRDILQLHACNDDFNPLALRGILTLIAIGYTEREE